MISDKKTIILAIETSTDICSAALSANGATMDSIVETGARMQTARLAPMIEELLKRNGLCVKDCSAVAVSSGPGSYTGLRVGVSMAKGLCFGAGIPLIGIGTLDILASQGIALSRSRADYVIPMIDARRMEVYQALYDSDGSRIGDISPMILDGSSYSGLPSGKRLLFCGNGCFKFESIIEREGAVFVPCSPSADYMSRLAYEYFINENFEDVAYMEPFYLKDFAIGVNKKKILG